jgi:spore coat protein U-like protein
MFPPGLARLATWPVSGARAILWGDGTGGTQTYPQVLPPLNQDITVQVFGRIPAGQDVSAGVYTNTVTVTIFF